MRGRQQRRNIEMPVIFFSVSNSQNCVSRKRILWECFTYPFEKGPYWAALHWSSVPHDGQRPSQMAVDDFGGAASNNLVTLWSVFPTAKSQVLTSPNSHNLPRYITRG